MPFDSAPLAIDLFCGLGGWAHGLIAEGYYTVGFDIERHEYGDERYPGDLVIQDVLTLHGSQFRDAALIVASPPCQRYSYMAMPWTRAKAQAAAIRADGTGAELEKLNRLFDACFRIQREACEAAGRHIPLIVENVRGAIPWVGRSRWNFGSFHLWGDVPALMPVTLSGRKVPGFRFDGSGRSFQSAAVLAEGYKTAGMNWSDRSKTGQDFTRIAGKQAEGRKHHGDWFRDPDCPSRQGGQVREGIKNRDADGYQRNNINPFGWKAPRNSSNSPRRKAASAMIAKIPEPLARHIARIFKQTQNPSIGGRAWAEPDLCAACADAPA